MRRVIECTTCLVSNSLIANIRKTELEAELNKSIKLKVHLIDLCLELSDSPQAVLSFTKLYLASGK